MSIVFSFSIAFLHFFIVPPIHNASPRSFFKCVTIHFQVKKKEKVSELRKKKRNNETEDDGDADADDETREERTFLSQSLPLVRTSDPSLASLSLS